MTFYGYSDKVLRFAKESIDDKSIWGAILEKAWAKARGNYIRANGDSNANSIATLTGVPVFNYECNSISTDADLNSAYSLMKAAEDAHYIIGAQT